MAIGGAFLGGGVEVVPAGYCKLEIQIMTEDRNGLNGTVTVTGGGNSYTATAGTDGRATINVVSGVTYTVSTTVTGFNGGPQLVIAESATIKYVRFDVIKTSVGTDTRPVKFVNGAPVAVPNDFAVDSAVVHIAGTETITGIKTLTQPMATTRAYSSANTSDIVTIGTLQASTDVVHRTGNESIAGTKTFTNDLYVVRGTPNLIQKDTGYGYNEAVTHGRWELQEKNGYRLSMHRVETSIIDAQNNIYQTTARLTAHTRNTNNQEINANFTIHARSDGNVFALAPWRSAPSEGGEVLTVGNGVTLGTEQTIAGKKNFTGGIDVTTNGIAVKNNSAYSSGEQYSPSIQFYTNPNSLLGNIATNRNGSTACVFMDVRRPSDNAWMGYIGEKTDGVSGWGECTTRAYNASNTGDIVTIGLLQASTDVVHRSGNEVIAGTKEFTGGNHVYHKVEPNYMCRDTRYDNFAQTVSGWTCIGRYWYTANNGAWFGGMEAVVDENGNRYIQIALNTSRTPGQDNWQGTLRIITTSAGIAFAEAPTIGPQYRCIRNIMVAPFGPSGLYDGDIWIQY